MDTWDYVWDDDNRLISVSLNTVPVVEYEYDSSSRLLQRVEGGTTTNYIWDGWDLVREEKSGAVNEVTDYLCPEGEVLAFKRGGDWYYLHGDALSSTQLVTDENGAVVGRYVYGAWGEELSATESVPGLFENRFVGGLGCRRDSATGMVYMRHRWYDVQLQRFISRDPMGLRGGSNLYEYCNSSPIDFLDDLGASPMAVAGAAATAACIAKVLNTALAYQSKDMFPGVTRDGRMDRYHHCYAACGVARCLAVAGAVLGGALGGPPAAATGAACGATAINVWGFGLEVAQEGFYTGREFLGGPAQANSGYDSNDLRYNFYGSYFAQRYPTESCESSCRNRLDDHLNGKSEINTTVAPPDAGQCRGADQFMRGNW